MVKPARLKMTFDITKMSLAPSDNPEAHFVVRRESDEPTSAHHPRATDGTSPSLADNTILLNQRRQTISHKDCLGMRAIQMQDDDEGDDEAGSGGLRTIGP
jgi:hypothetical protein